MSHENQAPPRIDFDAAPWAGRIKYTGYWPWPYSVHITHGPFQYGPDGGAFLCFTYKGAKRKMERELYRARKRQARKLGIREVQETPQQWWDRKAKEIGQ